MSDHLNLTKKISDLKRFSEEKRMSMSASTPYLPSVGIERKEEDQNSKSSISIKRPASPSTKVGKLAKSILLNTTNFSEKPPTRKDIIDLDNELEDKVRLVMESQISIENLLDTKHLLNNSSSTASFAPSATGAGGNSFSSTLNSIYNPTKDSLQLLQKNILANLQNSLNFDEINNPNNLYQSLDCSNPLNEPWLESYVRCESLKLMCDEISSKFSDMLSVTSAEFGNLSRKLRLTYKQSFEEIIVNFKNLREEALKKNNIIKYQNDIISNLKNELNEKEISLSIEYNKKIQKMTEEYNLEKKKDEETRLTVENKAEQMSETLKNLNNIFRNMKNDTNFNKFSDLKDNVERLKNDYEIIKKEKKNLEDIQLKFKNSQNLNTNLTNQIKQYEIEINLLKSQLSKREEIINHLMEREVIRNSEIEKLQKIAKIKEEELESLDLQESATSILCIKCKKSLDDMSNIRSILGGNNEEGKIIRLQCENFRILLPNMRGKKPARSSAWLRVIMRSILLTKMKEDAGVRYLKGPIQRFPAFVYSWFCRNPNGQTGINLSKILMQSDEDRWAFYYGLRALYKEDPECSLLWTLLDESFGQDGLSYVLYTLGVVLSLGDAELWAQFGRLLSPGNTSGSGIESVPLELLTKPQQSVDKSQINHIPQYIWVKIEIAKEAARSILSKSMAPHIQNAIDAIDAMKVKPEDIVYEDPEPKIGEENSVTNENNPSLDSVKPMGLSGEATHINLFLFIRIMLQQLQADQIHRNAAIRLMFETASVGALTPNFARDSASSSSGSNIVHVEYPQFQSICRTIFPTITITEMASLYQACYIRSGGISNALNISTSGKTMKGQGHGITAEIFISEADARGFFVHSLRLPPVPLLKNLTAKAKIYSKIELEAYAWAGISISYLKSIGIEDKKEDALAVANAVIPTPREYSKASLFSIRSKLATLIHRRFACAAPHINFLITTLPEYWKSIITEAIENVKLSLDETYIKTKQWIDKEYAKDTALNSFVDGIEPYIMYRRLISLVSLAISLTENIYLPTEIFREIDLVSDHTIAFALHRVDSCLSHLEESLFAPYSSPIKEKLNSSSFHTSKDEQNNTTALIPLKSESGSGGSRHLERYRRFEFVREVLVARRLQFVYKKFLHSQEVPVPRLVRMQMSPGYLTNSNTSNTSSSILNNSLASNSILSATFSSLPTLPTLKQREVYRELWWIQASIAGIYHFKLHHDKKAALIGLPPLTLSKAVVSWHYYQWGCTEVAERMIHDLFLGVKAYKNCCPRLRLFSIFIGSENNGRSLSTLLSSMSREATAQQRRYSAASSNLSDIDSTVLSVLESPQALAIYFHFLLSIHALVSFTLLQSLNISSTNLSPISFTNTLFPSTEDPNLRSDKRDDWRVSSDLLYALAEQWGNSQSWHRGNSSVYKNLVDKMVQKENSIPNSDNQDEIHTSALLNVDDFLWLMIIQWAKLESFQIKKALNRGQLVQQSLTLSFYNNSIASNEVKPTDNSDNISIKSGSDSMSKFTSLAEETKFTSDNKTGSTSNNSPFQNKVTPKIHGSLARTLTLLPMGTLKGIADSIYKQGATDLTNEEKQDKQISSSTALFDLKHYASSFIDCLRSRRPELNLENNFERKQLALLNLDKQANEELMKFLYNCVLWDTNAILFDRFLDTSAFFSSENKENIENISAENNLLTLANKAMYSAASLSTRQQFNNSFNPELSMRIMKITFQSYQNPFNLFLNKLNDDPKYSNNIDIKHRIQSTRFHLLALTEIFSTDITNISDRLYLIELNSSNVVVNNDSASSSSPPPATASDSEVSNSSSTLDVLKKLSKEREQLIRLVEETHIRFQSLMSSMSEITTLTSLEFPRDAWHFGAKLHTEKSYVYNIYTKSSIN